jgi:chorismate synthase
MPFKWKCLSKTRTVRDRYPAQRTDDVQFLEGFFEGKTTGTPIGFIIPNTNQKSSYSHIKTITDPAMLIMYEAAHEKNT